MGFVYLALFGLIVGVLASWVMPRKAPGGILMTIVLGIACAFVGGLTSSYFGFGGLTGFDLRSILIAVGGAILLLAAYGLITKK